jgi:aminoglycoside phosphotransferase (APT) family kinase protein
VALAPGNGWRPPVTPLAALDRLAVPRPSTPPVLIHAGEVNEIWRVEQGAATWALRITAPALLQLNGQRPGEPVILARAAAAGLGPALRAADPAAGLLLVRWVPGVPVVEGDLAHPPTWLELGTLLRRVHALPLPDTHVPTLSLSGVITRYATLAGAAADPLAAEALQRAARLDPGPVVICHNDPGIANVILRPTAGLLDWEYAAPGSAFMDLAAVRCQPGASDWGFKLLLQAYSGGGASREAEALLPEWCRLYRNIVALWHLALANLRRSTSSA